ncbi:FAD/NAD(P)-binding domain-containing protein [Abortiporus biennis]
MSKKSDDRKNVVVVGGGYAGFNLARELSGKLDASKYNLILITSKPYFVHLIAGIRLTVTSEGKLEDRALMPYDKLFLNGNGTHVIGTVQSIEEKESGKGGAVLLSNGEKIDYHVLALATGSKWRGALNFPDTDEEIHAHIEGWRKRFSAAKNVIIVGGGAVGIETAGEIKHFYPGTKVTIVHAGSALLNDTYPAKFRKDIQRRANLAGIDVVLDEYIDEIPEAGQIGVSTRSGKKFPDADLVLPTSGGTPNTDFIATLDSNVLTSKGTVKVKPSLEVEGHPGVYALGDIIEWDEQKQAAKAPYHSGVAAANILSYLSGQPQKKQYKTAMEGIFIPIGPLGGGGYLGILWGIVVGDWVVRLLKSNDLFISMFRPQLGLSK